MEKARIVVFEDNAEIKKLLNLAISETSHQIIAEAETRQEAEVIIDRLCCPEDELKADAILMDGNLRESPGHGEDASYLAELIKVRKISSVIIGFSANSLSYNPNIDIDFGKSNLLQIIDFINAYPDADA